MNNTALLSYQSGEESLIPLQFVAYPICVQMQTPCWGFLDSSVGKDSACHAGDLGCIHGLGRSPGKGKATHFSILAWRISRAKANSVLPREHTGHSKHPLPTTQEKTLHMDITRWSTPKSD